MTGTALVQVLMLSGCGGGSGGSSAPVPVAVAPVPMPSPPPPPPPPAPSPVCETRDVYTLCVTEITPGVSAGTLAHMQERFFEVYPALVERFNPGAPLSVNFRISTSSNVAYADGNEITYSAQWFIQHPEDYDVVVHEVMHVVQSYSSAPGWLTEGIADYVRYYYGANNAAAGWQLEAPSAGDAYTSGYRITAGFLVWVETEYAIALVDELDRSIRSGTYEPGLWISWTGESVDALWSEYVSGAGEGNPGDL